MGANQEIPMSDKLNEPEKKRAFGLGSRKGETHAVDEEARHVASTSTRPVNPTPEGQKHDQLAQRQAEAEDRQEALLDEAIEETFPGSDPISPKHIT